MEELDRKWGARWCPSHAKYQFYNVQKFIINKLQQRAVVYGDYDAYIAAVFEEIEMERQSSCVGLRKFSAMLKQKEKQNNL